MVPSSVVKDVAPPHLIAKDESKLCIPRKFDILLEKYLDNNHSSERWRESWLTNRRALVTGKISLKAF
jgi:hypothetical protein